MYKIEFKKSAKKEFLNLPSPIKKKVIEALNFLSHNPYSDLLHIKKLKSIDNLFRLRIADYRLLYEIEDQRLIVIVIKIGHRSEVYKKL